MGKLKISRVTKKYSDTEKQIILYINFGYKEFDVIKQKHIYKPLRYYTGIRIKNSEWSNDRKEPLVKKVQVKLIEIENAVERIYNFLITKKENVTPDMIKEELDVQLKDQHEVSNTIQITDYIRTIMLSSNSKRTAITLKSYNRLANKLEEFENNFGITLTTQNLNEELYLAFMDEMKKQLNRRNSVWGIQKDLKAVLNEISRKYKIQVFHPTNDISKTERIQSVTEENLYFDFEKIQAIQEFIPESDRLKNVKLILLTLLFTGCRYSDVFKIKPEYEFNQDNLSFRYTRFITQKGSQEIVIPILKPLEEAYKENDGQPPYPISDVKFNKYVKELSKAAELTETIKKSYTNSHGKKEFEENPFYAFVSSHIGRRSFITNLINYIPVTILSKITGHALTNKNVIFSYNKISLLDNAVLLMKELQRIQESHSSDFPIKLVDSEDHQDNF